MAQGAPTLKRVHFELGGKNPVIVFDDADLDRALDAVVFMIYSLNGERCTSSSRLLVQQGIAERRSEEHTSELQSHLNLVCRLLLEKKKNNNDSISHADATSMSTI